MAAVVVTRHGLQGPRQAQDTVNVRINVAGRAHLFGGRVGARRRGECPGQQRRLFIFDRHERVAAEQQYVAKLKCLYKVGLGRVGVAATPAAEATASPGRAIERSGCPARTARIHAEVTAVDTSSAIAVDTHPMPTWSCSRSTGSRAGRRCNQSATRT